MKLKRDQTTLLRMKKKNKKKILITGSKGFIGYHLCMRLIKENIKIIAIDNFNSYYDINLKRARQKNILSISNDEDVKFEEIDIITIKLGPGEIAPATQIAINAPQSLKSI